MPAFKTREELVAEALTELFADGGSGQSPDAEDRDAVDRKVDGLIEELAARNIVTVERRADPARMVRPARRAARRRVRAALRPAEERRAARGRRGAAESDDARRAAPPARHRGVLPRRRANEGDLMVAVPLPVTSSPGSAPQEGAGRLINALLRQDRAGRADAAEMAALAGLAALTTDAEHAGVSRLHRAQRDVDRCVIGDARACCSPDPATLYAHHRSRGVVGLGLVTVAKNRRRRRHRDRGGHRRTVRSTCPRAARRPNFADADLPQPNSVANVKGYLDVHDRRRAHLLHRPEFRER